MGNASALADIVMEPWEAKETAIWGGQTFGNLEVLRVSTFIHQTRGVGPGKERVHSRSPSELQGMGAQGLLPYGAAFPMRCLPGATPGKDEEKEKAAVNRAGGDPGWKQGRETTVGLGVRMAFSFQEEDA